MEYPPRIRALMDRSKAAQGDALRVRARGETYEGVLMPHTSFSGEDILTLKLGNGYNIGIAAADVESVEVTARHAPHAVDRRLPPPSASKPTIAVLGLEPIDPSGNPTPADAAFAKELTEGLRSRAKAGTGEAIRQLIGLQARTARIVREGTEVEVPVEDVVPGDEVVVEIAPYDAGRGRIVRRR